MQNTQTAGSDELLRQAAGKAVHAARDVRAAVHDLTLHALRSRILTMDHTTNVVKAISSGIRAALQTPVKDVAGTANAAAHGMEEAVAKALLAIELAVEEFARSGAQLSPGEQEQIIGEMRTFAQSLGAELEALEIKRGAKTTDRAKRLAEHLRTALADVAASMKVDVKQSGLQASVRESAADSVGAVKEVGTLIAMAASGALAGMAAAIDGRLDQPQPHRRH